MRRHRTWMLLAAGLLAGCSSEKTRDADSGSGSTSTTIPAATSTAPADTSTEPATTEAPTTGPPTTTIAPVPSGWTSIVPADVRGITALPCCGDTFHGVPSPPLPAAGGTLADGDYRVTGTWADDPTAPLVLTVRRFEQCAVLPAGACEDQGGSYPADALGVDPSARYDLTLPLDDQLRVVLGGFYGWDAPTQSAAGNGFDLAALAVAVDESYWSLIGSRLEAGEDHTAVFADVAAHPADGWGPGLDGSEFSLSYTFDGAPPLLIQGPQTDADGNLVPGRGANQLGLVSLHVEGGRPTLFVYAGFYS